MTSRLDVPRTTNDSVLASGLAEAAGRLLLDLRQRTPELEPADLRDAGDAASHGALMQALAEHRPDDAVLSEEGKDDPARLSAERVWIVDPLDGTREYGEPGRTDWAVHVALWSRDAETGALSAGGLSAGGLSAGAIALPARKTVLDTGAAPQLPVGPVGGPIRVAVSRSRPPSILQRLGEILDLELVPMGSAGVKIAAVLTGEVDAYVHAGGQYEWDSAAPVAVAQAAGAHASRLDGSPLIYNRADPSLPDLVVCRPELGPALLSAIAEAGQ